MSKRIVIIGGGVVGLSVAYYCRQRGFDVTVLERHGPQRDGCSYGNAGFIVPSHFVPLAAPGMVRLGLKWMLNPESPFYIRPRISSDLLSWLWRFWRRCTAEHVEQSAPLLRDLNYASRKCYEELAAELGDSFELHKAGLMMLCKTQHALDDEARVAEQAAALGMPAQVLDAHQAAALNPGARMDICGAVYFPDDCHLAPDRFMAALQAILEQRLAGSLESGGRCRFAWNTEALGVRLQEDRRIAAVKTTIGDIDADEVVLAAGSWSPLLARQLRLKLPMQAGKGYSLTLEHPRQSPTLPMLLTEARIAVTPMQGRLRFGGTMEISGLNEEIAPRRVRGIIKAVPRFLPEFGPQDFEGVRPWRGLRPCSPDGLPYIGRTERCDNLLIATGHAMMGLSLGPITGQLIAELLVGQRPSLPLDQLSPDRYS